MNAEDCTWKVAGSRRTGGQEKGEKPGAEGQQLPGWGADSSEPISGSLPATAGRARGKRGGRLRGRSDEEIVASLVSQTEAGPQGKCIAWSKCVSCIRSVKPVQATAAALPEHPFFARFVEAWRSCSGSWSWASVRRLVVLGLGSPESSLVARHQLALALQMRRLLAQEGGDGTSIEVLVFDPVLSDIDRRLLSALEMDVMPEDTSGRFPPSSARPTLFYLPHCEAWLCNNLLESQEAHLPSICIFGNSFKARRGEALLIRAGYSLCLNGLLLTSSGVPGAVGAVGEAQGATTASRDPQAALGG